MCEAVPFKSRYPSLQNLLLIDKLLHVVIQHCTFNKPHIRSTTTNSDWCTTGIMRGAKSTMHLRSEQCRAKNDTASWRRQRTWCSLLVCSRGSWTRRREGCTIWKTNTAQSVGRWRSDRDRRYVQIDLSAREEGVHLQSHSAPGEQ